MVPMVLDQGPEWHRLLVVGVRLAGVKKIARIGQHLPFAAQSSFDLNHQMEGIAYSFRPIRGSMGSVLGILTHPKEPPPPKNEPFDPHVPKGDIGFIAKIGGIAPSHRLIRGHPECPLGPLTHPKKPPPKKNLPFDPYFPQTQVGFFAESACRQSSVVDEGSDSLRSKWSQNTTW